MYIAWSKIEGRLKSWSTFAQVCGSAAAALIGLVFVAVLNQDRRDRSLAGAQKWGGADAESVRHGAVGRDFDCHPGQATGAVGAELTVLAVIAAGGLVVLDRRAKADASTRAAPGCFSPRSPNCRDWTARVGQRTVAVGLPAAVRRARSDVPANVTATPVTM